MHDDQQPTTKSRRAARLGRVPSSEAKANGERYATTQTEYIRYDGAKSTMVSARLNEEQLAALDRIAAQLERPPFSTRFPGRSDALKWLIDHAPKESGA